MVRWIRRGSVAIAFAAIVALGPIALNAVTQQEAGSGGGTTSNRTFTTNSGNTNGTNTNTTNTNGANTNTANTNGGNTNTGNTNGTNTNRGLEAAKLRVCQNRQAAIGQILSRMADRAQRQLDVFTTITERVQVFYARKGRTLSNYDALVADANAKKTAADVQVTALGSAVTFNCTVDNPKGIVQSFKDKLRTTNAALKDYRTAVKNLISGVKSVQGQAASNGNTNVNASNTNG
jgi:hypothetical protein